MGMGRPGKGERLAHEMGTCGNRECVLLGVGGGAPILIKSYCCSVQMSVL